MYKYLIFKESTRVGSQNLYRSVFLEVSQERIPGSHPGMHSWMTSRNALLEDLQEHAPGQALGGGVKCLLFHTVPLQQKQSVKIWFSPFHKALDSFSFFKNRVPGNNPGMHFWMTFRNALLGDLQDHTPGEAFGTYFGTLLEC